MRSDGEGTALILGAGSAISRAVLNKLLEGKGYDRVVCVSRSVDTDLVDHYGERLQWLQSDYSEDSIGRVATRLAAYQGMFTAVFLCHGILHTETTRPEKRLEELNEKALHEVFHVNAVVPALWLRSLLPVLTGDRCCRVVIFSARIGSIQDNRRGGWYSYRASKAALNMLIKTVAIEYARRAPNVRFMLFHPGTTDTPLSKPFQRSVPPGKLFSTEFVAQQLLQLIDDHSETEQLVFLDWQGERIAW